MHGALGNPVVFLSLMLAATVFGLASISSWVRGLQLLVGVVLFGGIVGVRLGSGALPVAIRDVSIVLPLYLAFLTTRAGIDALRRIPGELALAFGAVVAWLAISALNPQDVSGLQLLIGLKVWTFYIPFVVVGIALAKRPDALFGTLRTLLVLGTVTCGIGILQAVLVRLIGYEPAISLFFGEAASSVTQRFAYYAQGGGVYRIPATFSFGAQYVEFLFLYITGAIIVANADSEPMFRQLGRVAVFLGLFAGVLSGTKGALILFPIFLVALFASGVVKARLMTVAPIAVFVGLVGAIALGVHFAELFSFGARTTHHYLSTFVVEEISDALNHGVFGEGIGSSTGAVRHVASTESGVVQLGYESYYAKIAAELGSGGLAVFGIFFLVVAVKSLLIALRHRWSGGNTLTAPLAIYIIFNLGYSAKGFVLDTDPGNIFFWLALGVLLGFDQLSHQSRPAGQEVVTDARSLPPVAGARRQGADAL